MLHLEHKLTLSRAVAEAPNLTNRFSDDDLARIAKCCSDGYERDEQSRSSWLTRTRAAMDLALQIQQDKSFPWPNCSNIAFPLITIATMQFHSRSYPTLFSGPDIVKYRVPGVDKTGELTKHANLVARYMSHQCMDLDESFEEQHDRLLINVPIVGCAFVKTQRNTSKGINTSTLVQAQDLVIDYFAKSVDGAARKTQLIPLYRNEVYERCVAGTFRDVLNESWYKNPYQTPSRPQDLQRDRANGRTQPEPDDSTPILFGEQHCWLDLDEDGYAEPYIVTFDIVHKQIVRIVARWEREEDVERVGGRVLRINATEYYTKFGLIPAPDGSIYDVGFGVLLGPLNESVNTIVNQLVDAGTMSVAAGGFLSRGVKIAGGSITFQPFGWKRVDSTGDDLRKGIFPLPVREPSAVLFNLLTLLINYVQRISGSTDVMAGENPGQNTPAYNMNAMVEQGSKIYSAIFKRCWRSLRDEFRKLYILNARHMPARVNFGEGAIGREYFLEDPSYVVPAADPNMTSESMKLQQAVTLKQAAMTTPGYNKVAVEHNFLRALRVDGVETLFPGEPPAPPPPDPKIVIEQMRDRREMLRMRMEQDQFAISLMEEHRLNTAKIIQLQADAAKLMTEAGGAQSAQQLEVLRAAIDAYSAHNDSLARRAELLMKGQETSGSPTDGGGSQGMAPPSDDPGVQDALDQLAGAAQGTMGLGLLQPGQ